MKIKVNGVEYDAAAQPFIGDLRLLKTACGFGWGTVIKRLQALDQDTDFTDLLDDTDFLEALTAWMWMSRMRAGERELTFDEASMIAVDQIEFVGDEDNAEPDAAPTSAPTDSGRGDGNVTEATPLRKRSSTKTSKQPSMSA